MRLLGQYGRAVDLILLQHYKRLHEAYSRQKTGETFAQQAILKMQRRLSVQGNAMSKSHLPRNG